MNANKLGTAYAKAKHLVQRVSGHRINFVAISHPIRELVQNLQTFNQRWALFWVFFFRNMAPINNAVGYSEQVCFYMCPYGRFQSVMFDKDRSCCL